MSVYSLYVLPYRGVITWTGFSLICFVMFWSRVHGLDMDINMNWHRKTISMKYTTKHQIFWEMWLGKGAWVRWWVAELMRGKQSEGLVIIDNVCFQLHWQGREKCLQLLQLSQPNYTWSWSFRFLLSFDEVFGNISLLWAGRGWPSTVTIVTNQL